MTFGDKLMTAMFTGSSRNAQETKVDPRKGRVSVSYGLAREEKKQQKHCYICGLDTHTDRNCTFKR